MKTITLTNPAGNLSLTVSEDKLSAHLTIHKSGQLINEHDILDLIDEAGIKYGFEDALRYIRKHNLEKEFDQPFPLALCKAGADNSEVKYFFDTGAARAFSPRINPAEIHQLTCVEAGTVLADLRDNIFSREGSIYNVLGEMITSGGSDEEAAQAIAGENVEYDHERGQYISTKAGYIGMDDEGRIHIHCALVVDGDLVDMPELRTPVDLIVEGAVRGSFLAVQGNLSITGELRESSINCGGDLILGEGVVSCRQPGLEVLGDMRCGRIYRSKILCKGELRSGEISASEVIGEKGVYTTVENGIIHSSVQSANRIETAFAGEDEPGSQVSLEITISPFLKDLLMQLTREIVQARQNGNQEKIEEIRARISTCETELDRELNGFLSRSSAQTAGISIAREVYPILQVRVLKHDYQIRDRRFGLSIDEKN